jgi:hypothetical protein
MTPVETILLARHCGVRLSVVGDKVRIESDDPPPPELRAAVLENKAALLAMLSAAATQSEPWDAAAADGWMQTTLVRIGDWYESFGNGCAVDTPEFDRHEALIDAAYIARDTQGLRSALEAYEAFAFEIFTAASAPNPRECPDCHKRVWWRRDDGSQVCSTCHPDPQPPRAHPQEAPMS